MKKVKMSEIYNSVPILNELSSMKMPPKVSMKVLNIIQELNNHLKSAESTRTELIDLYGKKNANGEIVVPENKKSKFIDELNEKIFLKEIDVYSDLLVFEDFDDDFKISPADFSLINFLIK